MSDNNPLLDLLREYCKDNTRDNFSRLPVEIQEVLYDTSQKAKSMNIGNPPALDNVVKFYTIEKVSRNEPLTEDQYRNYGIILREASDNNVTLDNPPVKFDKKEVSSRIGYRERSNYEQSRGSNADIRMYVDIKRLTDYMGTDDIGAAHTTMYETYSTELLAWILQGVHFAHHMAGDNDIKYKREEMSFIKYLLTSVSPKIEIPRIIYDEKSKLFDIEDGRHRLGLYSYLGLNGMVYTNPEGTQKIIKLGGHKPQPEDVRQEISEIQGFKNLGVWDIAQKAVADTNSEKEALNVKPTEPMSYGKFMAYKRAIRYIYRTKAKSKPISPMEQNIRQVIDFTQCSRAHAEAAFKRASTVNAAIEWAVENPDPEKSEGKEEESKAGDIGLLDTLQPSKFTFRILEPQTLLELSEDELRRYEEFKKKGLKNIEGNRIAAEQYEKLSKSYSYFGQVAGDGNCFYRSAVFSWLVMCFMQGDQGRAVLQKFSELVQIVSSTELCKDNKIFQVSKRYVLEAFKSLGDTIPKGGFSPERAYNLVAKAINEDLRLDIALMAVIRYMVGQWMLENQDTVQVRYYFTTGIDNPSIQMGDTYDDMNTKLRAYIDSMVLSLGQDAELFGTMCLGPATGIIPLQQQIDRRPILRPGQEPRDPPLPPSQLTDIRLIWAQDVIAALPTLSEYRQLPHVDDLVPNSFLIKREIQGHYDALIPRKSSGKEGDVIEEVP